MTENNENNQTEPHRPRYLPPLQSVKKESKIRLDQLPSLPPKPSDQREPKDSLLSFSASGRLGRLSFQAAIIGLIFVLAILMSVFLVAGIFFFPGFSGKLGAASSNILGLGIEFILLMVIFAIALIYFSIVLIIRRLHDLNLSGWWMLLCYIPSILSAILNHLNIFGSHIIAMITGAMSALFYLYVILAPGTKGPNRFGPERLTSFVEKFFGVIGLVIAVVATFVGQYQLYFPAAPHSTDTALATPSTTVSSSASTNYDEPYPFTAQEFWAKILKLTALPDGTLSKAGVDDALGTKLQPDKDMTKMFNHPYFTTTSGVDWYFSSSFESDLLGLKGALFSFGWTNAIGSTPPTGMCINAGDVKPSLISQGWIEEAGHGSVLGILRTDYMKGKDQEINLSIYSDTDSKCITGFKLMAPTKPASTS